MIQRHDYKYIYHKVGDHLVQFEISDEDFSGDPQYWGYLAETGSWIIQKRDIAAGTYRYAIGTSGYKTAVTGAWATRAALTYGYFDAL